MKFYLIMLLCSLSIVLSSCKISDSMVFGNSQLSIEEREVNGKVNALLARMTLAEKVGQLNQYNGSWDVTGPVKAGDTVNEKRLQHLREGMVGSMLNVVSVDATREAQRIAVEESRLGIPLLFAYDVIHGYQTMFPVPLGETASWDLALIERSARIAAIEASAAGIHWTFAPMVDVGRDPRFGRVMEGAGEDPYLGSLVAVARVKGFQGDVLSANNTIAACAKHFAGYAFAEAGRDYNTVDISETTLRNIILPPFLAASEAGVATFMNAFNEHDGVPSTGSDYLQNTILKGEWGYDGVVVSDWGSISEMQAHGYAKDLEHAAEIAINAGNDVDMESSAYVTYLTELVSSGQVDRQVLDRAVKRVLTLKYRMGLFDDPYRYSDVKREEQLIGHKDHLLAARIAASHSAVLLKNANSILPLNKTGQRIAVIGPLAKDKDSPLGNWRAKAVSESAVSLYEGIEAAMGETALLSYAKGTDLATDGRKFHSELTINTSDMSGFDEAIAVAKSADIVVMAIGEDAYQSGEGRSQVSIELAGVQQELFDAIHEVNQQIVVVLMTGRPLAVEALVEKSAAVLVGWHGGSAAGSGLADVLFGDVNPSGKLPMTFPRNVGQLPLYYNAKNTGRPGPLDAVFWSHYTDAPNTPLFPFGYGLSYTQFDYSSLSINKEAISNDDLLMVSVNVSNTGEVSGEEVVQLYIRDLVATTTRPVRELKAFDKITLQVGETKTVSFKLTPASLGFYGSDGRFRVEPGDFELFVGGSSAANLQTTFTVMD